MQYSWQNQQVLTNGVSCQVERGRYVSISSSTHQVPIRPIHWQNSFAVCSRKYPTQIQFTNAQIHKLRARGRGTVTYLLRGRDGQGIYCTNTTGRNTQIQIVWRTAQCYNCWSVHYRSVSQFVLCQDYRGFAEQVKITLMGSVGFRILGWVGL